MYANSTCVKKEKKVSSLLEDLSLIVQTILFSIAATICCKKKKGSKLQNYWNDEGSCVPNNWCKSLLQLLIKPPINCWCMCAQGWKSNGFWHNLGIVWMGGDRFYTLRFIEPAKKTSTEVILYAGRCVDGI